MDSLPIAHALEELQPTPSLHLDSPYATKVQEIITKYNVILAPAWLPRVPTTLLPPRSAEYFERTRAARFGCPTSDLETPERLAEAWEAFEPAVGELSKLLGENPEGPFFMGETVSYADFIVAGWLRFYERANGETFRRVVGRDEAFGRLYEACGGWLERDD